MRSPGRVRRMQPRIKYKQHSSLRRLSIPTRRNIALLIILVVTAALWSHRIGLFSSSEKPKSSTFEHLISDQHNPPPSNHTTEHRIPIDIDSNNRIQIEVAPLDPNNLAPESQRPGPAPIHSTRNAPFNPRSLPHPAHAENHQSPVAVAVRPNSLNKVLRFTPATAVNFMHFHKTGGVSFKTLIFQFYHRKNKRNGEPVYVRDACYVRHGAEDDSSRPTFLMWRCDWEPIREMAEEDRNKHDFIFGHQYWANGAGELLNKRDLRSFTILRHPFDRKVSFYYHFFVREVGKREQDVTFEDIKNFLLHDKLTVKADLGRDLGPNYMAGRLLSDGTRGFMGNSSYAHYEVAQEDKARVAEEAKSLLREYVFVGLQKESSAARCMLRKVVETFNEVNGINNEGIEDIDKEDMTLNKGSYSIAADDIWKRFTQEEKAFFDRKERVDLLIYQEGERLFREHIKLFGCVHRVQDPKYK